MTIKNNNKNIFIIENINTLLKLKFLLHAYLYLKLLYSSNLFTLKLILDKQSIEALFNSNRNWLQYNIDNNVN